MIFKNEIDLYDARIAYTVEELKNMLEHRDENGKSILDRIQDDIGKDMIE